MASPLFVSDIKENEATKAKPPSFPQIKSSTGFPEHKKRTKISAFRQKRQGIQPDSEKPKVFLSSTNQPLEPSENVKTSEKSSIDRENNERLASMSSEEIEQARQELLSGLDPSLLEMLLKRANLDEGANTLPPDIPPSKQDQTSKSNEKTTNAPEIRIEDTSVKIHSSALPNESDRNPDVEGKPESKTVRIPPRPSVSEEADETDSPNPEIPHAARDKNIEDLDNAAPAVPPPEQIIDPSAPDLEHSHWPRARQPADLDPSDPDFLQNLHDKYFPSLPADPSKLAWMAPVPTPNSPADRESPYYPGQDSLPLSALRFDFRGALLPPRISRAVPVSKGLHHHGEAPEAAGYTIRELSRLARSAVPGQRCIAYQTLGRILYRLGVGDFGGLDRDGVGVGIWREMEEGAVLRSLYDEVEGGDGTGGRGGHRSAKVFATEAIWLFQKGGWKDKLRKAT
ncbi:RPAP1-like protein [Xylariaceae sp. FL0594]|nr:RPAP1-like protein [Xylariaceae sp. FL0594]